MLLRTANCSTRNVADPECEDTVNLKHFSVTRGPSFLGGVVGQDARWNVNYCV